MSNTYFTWKTPTHRTIPCRDPHVHATTRSHAEPRQRCSPHTPPPSSTALHPTHGTAESGAAGTPLTHDTCTSRPQGTQAACACLRSLELHLARTLSHNHRQAAAWAAQSRRPGPPTLDGQHWVTAMAAPARGGSWCHLPGWAGVTVAQVGTDFTVGVLAARCLLLPLDAPCFRSSSATVISRLGRLSLQLLEMWGLAWKSQPSSE